MVEMAERLGSRVSTTAGYAPHQNGVNERNHAVTDSCLNKIKKVVILLSDVSPRISLRKKTKYERQRPYDFMNERLWIQGFLRPETAQGIFVNFKRLLEFNQVIKSKKNIYTG